jgi:hypothetical protein
MYTKHIYEHEIEAHISYIPQDNIQKIKYDDNKITVACKNC